MQQGISDDARQMLGMMGFRVVVNYHGNALRIDQPGAQRRAQALRGVHQEGDGSIHVLLLADASEFVYRRLKRFEPELLASFRARWPQHNIVKVTVVPYIKNEAAREAIKLGGTFRVFRRQVLTG